MSNKEDPRPARFRPVHALLAVAALLVVGLLAHFSLALLASSEDAAGHERPRIHNPDKERIDKEQIEPLRKESLAESMFKLQDYLMYIWPGFMGDRGQSVRPILPFPEKIGQYDIETIMSNRRFLKVLHELAALPKARAATMVNKELEKSIPVYEKLFAAELKLMSQILKPDYKPRGFPGFGVAMNPDGSLVIPSLPGTRLQLFALALLAGNLELKECFPAVQRLAKQGNGEYQKLANKELHNPFMAYFFLQDGSVYNRQILGTGLLGTAPLSKKALVKKYENRFRTKELPGYDADATPYDWYGFLDVDFSKGRFALRYLQPIDDATFAELMREFVTEP